MCVPNGTPQNDVNELEVWQNQAKVMFAKALKYILMGLPKFRVVCVSNSYEWLKLASGFVLELLNAVQTLDPTLSLSDGQTFLAIKSLE